MNKNKKKFRNLLENLCLEVECLVLIFMFFGRIKKSERKLLKRREKGQKLALGGVERFFLEFDDHGVLSEKSYKKIKINNQKRLAHTHTAFRFRKSTSIHTLPWPWGAIFAAQNRCVKGKPDTHKSNQTCERDNIVSVAE